MLQFLLDPTRRKAEDSRRALRERRKALRTASDAHTSVPSGSLGGELHSAYPEVATEVGGGHEQNVSGKRQPRNSDDVGRGKKHFLPGHF